METSNDTDNFEINKKDVMDNFEATKKDFLESSNSVNSNIPESTYTNQTGFTDSTNTLGSVEHGTNKAASELMAPEEAKKYKRGIYKNVLLISLSFLLLFMAFESMAKLQSSINTVANLGTFSMATLYGSLVISCMFIPSLLINWLKVKWSLVVCVFCYTTYIAAQYYPEFYTLIPTAFLVGMGAAPMWSAKCTYLTHVAHKYATLDGIDPEAIVVKFFGIFFFFFQCNSVFGNIISAVIFNSNDPFNSSSVEWDTCGSNFCPPQIFNFGEDNSNTTDTDDDDKFGISDTQRYILASVFLCCSVAAALNVAFFVDPLTKYGEDERNAEKPPFTISQLLVATFRHMKTPYQLLIAPLTFWSGIEQGFFTADFTAGYVTCAFGVQLLPFVLMCYGICDALTSLASGFLIKYVGRAPMFLFGAAINVLVLIILFAWNPVDASSQWIVYVLAGLWGMGDAIWQTQINAFYGTLFPSETEAAFSNYRLFESLGYVFAFVSGGLGLCFVPRIIMTLVFLGLGMVGYLFIEYLEWKKNKKLE